MESCNYSKLVEGIKLEPTDDIEQPDYSDQEHEYDDHNEERETIENIEINKTIIKDEVLDFDNQYNLEKNDIDINIINGGTRPELTIHPVPGTSAQNDNMIYFEIPVLKEECKCMVCGQIFEVINNGKEYICEQCLKKKDLSDETKTALSKIGKSKINICASGRVRPGRVRKKITKMRYYPLQCDECRKSCKNPEDLKRHKLTHSGEKPFPCNVCGKKFNHMSNLGRHKATHREVKPFMCEICYKTFHQASYLKKHNLTHSGEKPYGCVVCEKRFSDYSTLAKHKLIHSGERPYVCGICLKTFNQGASLKRHTVIHRDEKPFQCNICHKKFAQSYHLKRHLTIHRVKFVNMSLPKYRYPKLDAKTLIPNQGEGHRMNTRSGDDLALSDGSEEFYRNSLDSSGNVDFELTQYTNVNSSETHCDVSQMS